MTERPNIRRMEAIESTPFTPRFNAATDIDQKEWKKVTKYMQGYAFEKSRGDISPKFYNRQKLRSFAALKVASPPQFAACVGEARFSTVEQLDDLIGFAFDTREMAENYAALQVLHPEKIRELGTLQLEETLREMRKLLERRSGNDFGLAIMLAGNIQRLFRESHPMDDDFVAEAKEYVQSLLKPEDDPQFRERAAMGALAFAAQIRICRPDQAVQFTRPQWRMVMDALHESLRHDIGNRDPEYILWAAIVGANDVRITDHGIELTPPKDAEIKPVPESTEMDI